MSDTTRRLVLVSFNTKYRAKPSLRERLKKDGVAKYSINEVADDVIDCRLQDSR